MHLRTIAVATSLSKQSDQVARVAAQLARAAGARLHAIHVVRPEPSTFVPLGRPPLGSDAEPAAEDAGHALREQILRLGLEARDLAGWTIAVGRSGRDIAHGAERAGADLLVVGAGESQRVTLGTVAEAVLRESSIPVLVVRGDLAVPPHRVLLPVDLSPLSADALRLCCSWMAQVAGEEHTEARVLFVLSDEQRIASPQFTVAQLERLACTEVARLVAGTGAEGMQREVRAGEARHEIVAAARDWRTDLVVVGSHGEGHGGHCAPGGVSAAVARSAPCSVLVVPPEEADRVEAEIEGQILEGADWRWISDVTLGTAHRPG